MYKKALLKVCQFTNVYVHSFFLPLLKYGTVSQLATTIKANNKDDFKKTIVDYFCVSPTVD